MRKNNLLVHTNEKVRNKRAFHNRYSLYKEFFYKGVQFYRFSFVVYPKMTGIFSLKQDNFTENTKNIFVEMFFGDLANIEMMTTAYLVVDESDVGGDKLPRFRGLFGLRSLIGKNETILSRLDIKLSSSARTIKIEPVQDLESLGHFLEEIIYEPDTANHHDVFFKPFYFEHAICEFFDDDMFIFHFDSHKSDFTYKYHSVKSSSSFSTAPEMALVPHYGNNSPLSGKEVTVFLLSLYMRLTGRVVVEKDLYKKNDDSVWIFEKKLAMIVDDYFEIIKFFYKKFPSQLGGMDLDRIFLSNILDVLYFVEQIPSLLPRGVVSGGRVVPDGCPFSFGCSRDVYI